MTPRFIFWDLGDVLVTVGLELTYKRLARLSGRTTEEVKHKLWDGTSESPSPFVQAGLGKIDGIEFGQLVRERLKIDSFIPDKRILSAFSHRSELPGSMRNLLYSLKGKIPMGIISNCEKFTWQELLATFPMLRKETGIFQIYKISCHEGVMKPSKEIFERAFIEARENIGSKLARSECLFFDDKPANISAAQAFGFQSVRVARAGDPKIFETLSDLGVV